MLLRACFLYVLVLTTACGGAGAARVANHNHPATPAARELTVPRDSDGKTIHVRVTEARSDAQTLVVIHGGPGLSHHYTRALERLASAQLRVVTYDQRGVGRSSAAEGNGLGADQQVADLERIRLALGADRLHVLGHSWGGFVAMGYAATHPNRLASLLLIDSTPAHTASWVKAGGRFQAALQRLQAAGVVPVSLPPHNGPDCSPRLLAMLPVYYANPAHPATQNLGGSTCHTGNMEATWRASWHLDWRPGLARLAQPVLVAYGEADPFGTDALLPEITGYFAATAPRTSRYPACGHIPWEECPEPFFADVAAFLRAAGAEPAPQR